jgi:hypothetical protein
MLHLLSAWVDHDCRVAFGVINRNPVPTTSSYRQTPDIPPASLAFRHFSSASETSFLPQ